MIFKVLSLPTLQGMSKAIYLFIIEKGSVAKNVAFEVTTLRT